MYLAIQKSKERLIIEQGVSQDFICGDLNWGGEKSWDQPNFGEGFSNQLMQLSHHKKQGKNVSDIFSSGY